MKTTVTVDGYVLQRALARLRERCTELDADLSDMPAGAPRRRSKQDAYDQAHADYLALSAAILAGVRS